jgi:tRNA pseudouridine55 synthase
MQGFLVIDKSAGWTSRDAVNVVVKLCPRATKVGHAGTLDPLATGVLVVAVGKATRLISYAQEGTKTYRVEFLLGRTSDTEDVEGKVVELALPPVPSLEALEAAAKDFVGQIMQRPPAYSAIQVDGQRSYNRARRGEAVELAPRPVRIDVISLLSYEYPKFELEVTCGKGTYIRSLGRDIGEKLGSGAVMSQLRRTQVGAFAIEDAVTIERLRDEGIERYLRPMTESLPDDLPRIELEKQVLRRLMHGQSISLPHEEREIAVLLQGQLASIAGRVASGQYRASVNFLTAEEVA